MNPNNSQKLVKGQSNHSIYLFQDILQMLGERFEIDPEEFYNEFFGPSTEESVKLFQEISHLPQSGEIDHATAEMLWEQYQAMDLLDFEGHFVNESDDAPKQALFVECFWEDGRLLKRVISVSKGEFKVQFSESQYENFHLENNPVHLKIFTLEKEELDIIGDTTFLLAELANEKIRVAIPSLVIEEEAEVEAPSLSIKGNVFDRLQRQLKYAWVELVDNESGQVVSGIESDLDGQFEFILKDDLYDSAMDCTDCYFKVLYDDRQVANTLENDPPIIWNIGKPEDERIEIIASVTGRVVEKLEDKNKAVRFATVANKTYKELEAEGNEVAIETMELVHEGLTILAINALKDEEEDDSFAEIIQDIDFSKCAGKSLPIKKYIESHLRRKKIKQSQFDRIQKKLEKAQIPTKLEDFIALDKPLAELHQFNKLVNEGFTHQLAEITSIDQQKCDTILQHGWRVDASNFSILQAIQDDGVISEEEVKQLKKVSELHVLFNKDLSFITPIATQIIPKIKKTVDHIEDLVPLRANDWQELIDTYNIVPPKELTSESYGQLLEKRIESAFPSRALLDRYTPIKIEDIQGDFLHLEKALKQVPNLLKSKSIRHLDTSELTETEVIQINESYHSTLKKLNRYHGLDVHRMSNEDVDIQEHLRHVHNKIELIESFYENNSEKDLLNLDLGPNADLEAQGIDFTGILEDERKLVLRNIKMDQRLYGLTNDITLTNSLKAAGLYSATDINEVSASTLAKKLNIDYNVAAPLSYRAETKAYQANDTMLKMWELTNDLIYEIKKGGYYSPSPELLNDRKPPISISIENEILKRYDGYEDYFGSLDYCDCKHCNSIFSPAAYFVDLMAWLEKLVLNDVFDGDDTAPDKPGNRHPLHLKNRRPDLWYLNLNCENTSTLIPYLDIINEVMENYIFYLGKSKDRDPSAAAYFGKTPFEAIQKIHADRNEIVKTTYSNIYDKVNVNPYSIHSPFLLPLEEIKVFLQHFPISLEEIALSLDAYDEVTLARARLGISLRQFEIISLSGGFTSIDEVDKLNELLDIKIQEPSGAYKPMHVKDLISSLSITRSELTDLLETRFVSGLPDNPHTRSEKANNDPNSPDYDVQNNIERLHGIAFANDRCISLDYMHRFIRLLKNVPWSIEELDFVLGQVNSISDPILNEIVLQDVSRVLSLQKRFGIPIDEVCILFQSLSDSDVGISNRLVDLRFNNPPFSRVEPFIDNRKFYHPVFDHDIPTASADLEDYQNSPLRLPILLAGLNIKDEQLYELIENNSPLVRNNPLVAQASSPLNCLDLQEKRLGIQISFDNMSLLFRHTSLSKLLNLSIRELFQLIGLSGISAGYLHNGSLKELQIVLDYYDWWKTTEYTLDELAYLENHDVLDSDFPNLDEIHAQLMDVIVTEQSYVFKDTLFAYLNGVTEQQSKEIILANIDHQIKDELLNGINSTPSNYAIRLPVNLEIKDHNSTGKLLSRGDISGTLLAHLLNLNQGSKVDSQYFYTHRAILDLEMTINPVVSSLIYFLNFELFEPVIAGTQSQFGRADIKSYKLSPSATFTSLSSGVTLTTEQIEFLERLKNPGAPIITKHVLKSLDLSQPDLDQLFSDQNIFEQIIVEDKYSLTEHYMTVSNEIIVPSHIPVSVMEIHEALLPFTPKNVLTYYLGKLIELDQEKVKSLAKVQGMKIDSSYIDFSNQDIRTLVRKVFEASIILKSNEYSSVAIEGLNSIISNVIQDNTLSTSDKLIRINYLRPFVDENHLSDLAELLGNGFSLNQGNFSNINILVSILDSELTPVKLVNTSTGTGTDPITVLHHLSKRLDLSTYLGVGGNVINNLLDSKYDKLAIARDALLSAFRLKYPDESQWEKEIQPFFDQIKGIKRDALTDYLINGIDEVETVPEKIKRFRNTRDIYKHFLIDTELEGCARTSRLVAAISSVQVFIQRIMLNLEVSHDGKVIIKPDAGLDQERFASQWEWRKNYRVWEANRKVFLYPENYIEPSLRDNKTELFEELEADLLQREINLESVEQAYQKYMDGFEEISNYKILGSYQDKEIIEYNNQGVSYIDPEHSIFSTHIFAKSLVEPKKLLYRVVENNFSTVTNADFTWNSWQVIEGLAINADQLSVIKFDQSIYIIWMETITKPFNVNSIFAGYKHRVEIKCSYKLANGKWAAVKELQMPRNSDIIIENSQSGLRENIKAIVEEILRTKGIYEIEESIEIDANRDFGDARNVGNFFGTSHTDALMIFVAQIDDSNFDSLPTEYDYSDNDIEIEINYIGLILSIKDPVFDTGAEIRERNRLKISKKEGELSTTLSVSKKLLYNIGEAKDNHRYEGKKEVFSFSNANKLYLSLGHESIHSGYEVDFYKSKLSHVNYYRFVDDSFLWIGAFRKNSNVYTLHKTYIRSEIVPSVYRVNAILDHGSSWLNLSRSNSYFRLENARATGFVNSDNNERLYGMFVDFDLGLYFIGEILKGGGSGISGLQAWQLKSAESRKLIQNNKLLALDKFLALDLQLELKELKSISINFHNIKHLFESNPFENTAVSIYYWEIYFDIPFLIANYLNSQQKFAEAQTWYHYLFNPTSVPKVRSTESVDKSVWQFRPFFEHEIMSLREILEKQSSIQTYENDPFNPHAIARTRRSAFMKSIIMKYIDNLLDWGDHLFAQDTMESVNEATMLYILAYEILGDIPVSIGDCGERAGTNYAFISNLIDSETTKSSGTTPILIEEVETYYLKNAVTKALMAGEKTRTERFIDKFWESLESNDSSPTGSSFDRLKRPATNKEPNSPKMRPIFCIPPNKDLLAYWDRVDDRLFKIRNCMNIRGISRQLALFSPEIDPRLLVRARAQGLSIQNVLQSLSGNLPPYRFMYLIAKAKEYVGLVQSFGVALQGAMDRRDAERLTQLQSIHQKNILNMTRTIREQEILAAENSISLLRERKQSFMDRRVHYQKLVEENLSNYESQSLKAHQVSIAFARASSVAGSVAAVLSAIPTIAGVSNHVNTSPAVANAVATMLKAESYKWSADSAVAGKLGNWSRRMEGWRFQLKSVESEINIIDEQIIGAEIRKSITERNYEIFDQNAEQQQEIYDFIKNKFSNLGRVTWMTTQLNRLYRQAWESADTMAKMAERGISVRAK